MGSIVGVKRSHGWSYYDEDDLEECPVCGDWGEEILTEEYYEVFGEFAYDPDYDEDIEGILCCDDCGIWWDDEDDSIIHDVS